MNSEFRSIVQTAEDHYLNADELAQFRLQLVNVPQRLETYELLRERELEVFQAVADQLQAAFPRLDEALLNRALQYGIAILRYGAMAMLMGDDQYFQQRLLSWIPRQVRAYDLVAVEDQLLDLLNLHLSKRITPSQLSLMLPYFDQAKLSFLVPSIETPASAAELVMA
ncbi:MAG: hypothetical protein RLZZ511_946 [Cyanobacteriota bacterium]|jgi:hypothetical protein